MVVCGAIEVASNTWGFVVDVAREFRRRETELKSQKLTGQDGIFFKLHVPRYIKLALEGYIFKSGIFTIFICVLSLASRRVR